MHLISPFSQFLPPIVYARHLTDIYLLVTCNRLFIFSMFSYLSFSVVSLIWRPSTRARKIYDSWKSFCQLLMAIAFLLGALAQESAVTEARGLEGPSGLFGIWEAIVGIIVGILVTIVPGIIGGCHRSLGDRTRRKDWIIIWGGCWSDWSCVRIGFNKQHHRAINQFVAVMGSTPSFFIFNF